MKILFYNHTGQIGGAEHLLLMILARLDRRNFAPVLVCPESSPLQAAATDLGVPVEPVAILNARFTCRPDRLAVYLKSFVDVILDLRKKVRIIDSDLIHANSIRAGLVATVAAVGLRKRVIWHVHDLLPSHYPFNPAIRMIALLARQTRIVAVAQASAKRLSGSLIRLRGRITVIPNAVDDEKFCPDVASRQIVRNELQAGREDPIVGIVGRLTPAKGQLELIHAFKRVLKDIPTARLVIVGAPAFNQEQQYAELLETTASQLGISARVCMLGARSDVAAIMQALDLLVVNSSSEACCLAILEGMACGTPVLATRTGGTPEILEHGQSGWLVPWGDETALAATIVHLLNDSELRAQLAKNGKRVAAQFTVDRYVGRLQNFYIKALCIPTSGEGIAHQILDEKLALD